MNKQDYKKIVQELKERYEKIEADLKEYDSLLEKFKEDPSESLKERIIELRQKIDKEMEEYEELGYVEYEGKKLFFKDAEFLEKYKGKIKEYNIENNFISKITIPRRSEYIYHSGDLKKLKNLKELEIVGTSIKKLTSDKLPESIEVIYAGWCKNLKNYNLKNLNKLKKLNIEVTSIEELTYDKLPESIEEIDANQCKLKNYNLKNLNKLKKLNIEDTAIEELTYDKLPESIEAIYAYHCENLTKCSLKNLKNLKKLDISYSYFGIKKLGPEDIPESLQKLVVSIDQDMSEIKKDPRFKNLIIEVKK
ncbi:MAG: hypothetical protein QXJ20_02520 [Candidatus Aenigmatarchaeota archaeon]